jgi:drug/metabolite transporter (DMT)-like permease
MGQLLCIASALCFGAMAILGRFATASGVDTPTLLLLRFSLAAAPLWAFCAVRRVRLPAGRDLAILVGMGALGYAGQAFAYFSALEHASVGLVALLLYLHPFIVAILARVFLGHALRPVQLGAMALAVAGAALTVGNAVDGSAEGVLFGVATAAIYAVYILTGSLLSKGVSPIASTTVVVTSAAGVFAAAAAVRGGHLPGTAAGWAAVVAIALVCTVAAVGLFLAGLERLGPVRATIYSTVEPVVTVGLGALVLHEPITWYRAAGGALVLGGVLILARSDRQAA